ncbi:hypothetical protein [Bowmanella dokdonensis]|uniref:Uncharacterized protein n=1 Tax=Bowmanella dokdonensis TaxID=751969 RepID=A0A939DQ92_9ALTE|nr:hypothetical protein [Bowmanella dokdonensis]MBN7826764.1 hypothetical protein [Bowmanella dokdonensis]
MSSKSLPAYLQQILENHVAQSDLVYDDELKVIMERLHKLNDSVEKLKANIRQRRVEQAKNEPR